MFSVLEVVLKLVVFEVNESFWEVFQNLKVFLDLEVVLNLLGCRIEEAILDLEVFSDLEMGLNLNVF